MAVASTTGNYDQVAASRIEQWRQAIEPGSVFDQVQEFQSRSDVLEARSRVLNTDIAREFVQQVHDVMREDKACQIKQMNATFEQLGIDKSAVQQVLYQPGDTVSDMIQRASDIVSCPVDQRAEIVQAIIPDQTAFRSNVTNLITQATTNASAGPAMADREGGMLDITINQVVQDMANAAGVVTTQPLTQFVENTARPSMSTITVDEALQQGFNCNPATFDNLTDADMAVLAELSYAEKWNRNNMQYIRAVNEENLTISQYCKNLIEASGGSVDSASNNSGSLKSGDYEFLKAMMNSERYGDMMITHSDGRHVGNINSQVLCITPAGQPEHAILAFEGTNGVTQSWDSNAEYAGEDFTDNERWLYELVKRYAGDFDTLDFTGHSKGGRDGSSTAIQLFPEFGDKIHSVYNLDGPGYSKELISKYGDVIDALSDRIWHESPNDGLSVGAVLHSIAGHRVFLESSGHEQRGWNTDGTSMAHGESNLTYDLTSLFINFAVDSLGSQDTRQELVNRLLQAGSSAKPRNGSNTDGEGTDMVLSAPNTSGFDIEDILNNLENLDADDWTYITLAGVSVLLEGYMEVYEIFDEYFGAPGEIVIDVLTENWPKLVWDLAGIILPEVAGWIDPELGEWVTSFFRLCEPKIAGLEQLRIIINWTLDAVAKRQKAWRDDYLAAHEDMQVDLLKIREAYEALQRANDWLRKADEGLDDLAKAIVEKKTDESGLEYVVRRFFSKDDLLKTFMIDLLLVRSSNPNVNKGIIACDEIAREGSKLLGENGGTAEKRFYVHPGKLSSCAVTAMEKVNQIKQVLEDSCEVAETMGTWWQGEDFNSFRNQLGSDVDPGNKELDALIQYAGAINDLADKYKKFQEWCVGKFQYAS